jgi:diguanylate cyclase (GGDEF)-like protein/PAS domain S-box-containing protein
VNPIRDQPLILVVDDDDGQRLLAGAALRQGGFAVVEAGDGEQALVAFQREQPDIVLLDVMMPEMDGFAVCEALRQLPGGQYCPIVLVTGLDDVESIERAYEVGATDFITKPIQWLVLHHRVRYILRASQTEETIRKLSWVVERNPISILITDTRGIIEYANPKFSQVSGYSLEEIRGNTPYFLQTSTLSAEEYQRLQQAIAIGGVWQGELCSRHKDGEFFWEVAHVSAIRDTSGAITHFVWLREHITTRKQAEERTRLLDHYDDLTQLPNRVMLQERLREAIETARRHAQMVAVMFLDLDQFKHINDTLGHRVGDLLLRETARRLRDSLRHNDSISRARAETPLPQDLLARLGGDKFVVLLTPVGHVDEVTQVARHLLAALAKPFVIEGHEVRIGCGMGIALFPRDGTAMESLLRNADIALHHAKNQGRNHYQFHSEEVNGPVVPRMVLEDQLRKALGNRELSMHYQPRVALASGRIVGVEALLRWSNPELGMVSPLDFIPVAEEAGLMIPIGEWVLRTVCNQALAWKKEGLSIPRMAVNLSAWQIADSRFLEQVTQILAETGLSPTLLEFEITESLLMRDNALEILKALKRMGIELTVDDFGTGYSSPAHLCRFPIDRLKIDRSFVRDISHEEGQGTVAAAIVGMARGLRLGVVAEGVETDAQLEFLRALQCDEIQGYYFSRPHLPESIGLLLRDALGGGLDGEDMAWRDSRPLILVDDDPQSLMVLRRVALQAGGRLWVAGSPREAFTLIANQPTAVVFWNPACCKGEVADLPWRLRERSRDAACIALTGADANGAVRSGGAAAVNRTLVKPLSQQAVWTAMQALARSHPAGG